MTISTSQDSVIDRRVIDRRAFDRRAFDRRAFDHRAVDGYEPVNLPDQIARARGETAMFRRRSVQPTRRALLHVQAAGEPAVAPDLVSWYTERAFHFYLAGLRLPSQPRRPLPARNAARRLGAAFADLDAACAQVRAADGIDTVIVMATGRSAAAVALWRDARQHAADALILHSPEFSARPGLRLNIGCPVLVLTWQREGQRQWRGGPDAAAIRLGGHVTWLQLAPGCVPDSAPDTAPDTAPDIAPDAAPDWPGRQAYFDELGRWLGAYMYGQGRDRLL